MTKYFLLTIIFLIFSTFSFALKFSFTFSFAKAAAESTKSVTAVKNVSVSARSFRAWVKNVKKKLRQAKQDKQSGIFSRLNSTNGQKKLLSKINKQLQSMKVSKSTSRLKINNSLQDKGDLKNKDSSKDKNDFLLEFQLASFKELFPSLLLLEKINLKTKNKKSDCAYLKQKIVYDLYPNYENTKNIKKNQKLPYSHKELIKILQIICQ